jgi:streptomycin 6-kinase
MDVGYTGARKAQCATIMVGSGSRVVFSRTDTENSAWLKEGCLVSLALNEAINERKLDVVAVEIDDNAANKKKIEAFQRVNGPDHYREESVKALNDVFHAAKSMGRQALKIASTYVGILEQKLKVALPLIEISDEEDLSETFLDPVNK